MSCCIKNCTSQYYTVSKNIKFYAIPKETTVRQRWLKACQINKRNKKIKYAKVCSIHFEENCFELVKTTPQSNYQSVKEILRLKKGSIPTKLLNLENIQRRPRMSQSKKDNEKIKVPEKSSIVSTCTEFVQYAQQEQRLSQEETVTRMETDVAQNMEEAGKNMESDILQDTKKKVTKNIDKVATQNMEEQSEAQQGKQGINDNTNYVHVETLFTQLKKSKELNQKLFKKNKNLQKWILQLQAKIKHMTKNKHKEAETIAIDIIRRLSSEDIIAIKGSVSSLQHLET